MHINSSDGLITDVKIFSDALFPAMIDDISAGLTGTKYNGSSISAALEQVALKHKDTSCENYVRQFAAWLTSNM